MLRRPSTTLLVAALSLLGLACDQGSPDPVGTATEGDSEDDSGDDSTSTSGSSTTAQGDDCQYLIGDDDPADVFAGYSAMASLGPPNYIHWCSGEHTKSCRTTKGEVGTSLCVTLGAGYSDVWTTCAVHYQCTPDDDFDQGECGGTYCALSEGTLKIEQWTSWDFCCGSPDPCCWTPLVVNFDGAPIRFETAGAAAFDLSGQGECLSTDWPSAPWLALDRDGDGTIRDGRELFGSGTLMTTGVYASHGFEALAEFDVDRDGSITAADPIFHELVLWSDHDGDRRSALVELVPIANAQIVAIDLGFGRRRECDARGNCGVERATFQFRDERGATRDGEIVDVHLPCQ